MRAREAIHEELQKKIIGQSELIDLLLIALFANGHCLLMGVPGLAKTSLISALAEVLKLDFNRIQFTPDLMPADITGTDILEEDPVTGKRLFKFLKGPVFTNLLLADEINRTPPKTQAALLQSMQERQVSSGGKTYALSPPFLVFATQNPIEQEGTYSLPEAQLDRFMFHLNVDYPNLEEELEIVARTTAPNKETIEPVLSASEIIAIQDLVMRVPITEDAIRTSVELVRQTRPTDPSAPEMIRKFVSVGAGPRASQNLVLAAKSRAVLQGRSTVSKADILELAVPILRHRVLTNFLAEANHTTSESLIHQLLSNQ